MTSAPRTATPTGASWRLRLAELPTCCEFVWIKHGDHSFHSLAPLCVCDATTPTDWHRFRATGLCHLRINCRKYTHHKTPQLWPWCAVVPCLLFVDDLADWLWLPLALIRLDGRGQLQPITRPVGRASLVAHDSLTNDSFTLSKGFGLQIWTRPSARFLRSEVNGKTR